MSKTAKRILAACLAVILVCGSAGATVLAMSIKNNNIVTASATATEDTKPAASEDESQKIAKDETIYVMANSDGSVNKIIVSDWIKNKLGADSINDVSGVKDILNLKGDEGYTMGSDNAKVWDAKGSDIYYQGSIEKDLPVGLKVSYKLDGKDVSADEIAGKSGKVTIRFDYENKQSQDVTIDGKQEKIYVPYVMLTGMLLDNDVFTNVNVTNGKIVNDGQRTAVIGLALPGLQEDLNLNKDVMEVPDYVEITADAKDFKFGMTATIATNEVFNKVDMSSVNSLGDLDSSVGALNAGMKELLDGSSSLYEGLDTLLKKSGQLVTGINSLEKGGLKLKTGAQGLAAGSTELEAGTKELSDGLAALNQSSASLQAGVKQLVDGSFAQVTAGLTSAGVPCPALTISNYTQILDGLLASPQLNESQKSAIRVQKGNLDSAAALYNGIVAYTNGVGKSATGAAKAEVGAVKVKSGSAELNAGMTELYAGILTLKNSTPALISGVTDLKNGSFQLSEGLKKFNSEGIQKLVSAVDGDVKGLITRAKATAEVSKSYKTFTGLDKDMDGEVRFIYRTDSIEAK